MRVGVVATGLLLGAAVAAAQSGVRQEGRYWVRSGQTQPLSLPRNGVGRLDLITRGHVTVRGVEGSQIQIKMTQRVAAKTLAEAAREWGDYDVLQNEVAYQPPFMRMAILPPASLRVSIDLEISVPRSLPALVVQNQFGDVQVYDMDGNVSAMTNGGAIRADRIKGSFRCMTTLGNVMLGNAGGDTTCHTAGGDLEVGYAGGALTLTTEGGNIRVEKAGAKVHASSREGMIDIGEAKGFVTADTRGGLITVGSAAGVKAESAGGMVRLREASGPMNITTMMGNILAELVTGKRLQDSTLATGRGDITLTVPQGLPVTLRATHPQGMTPRIVSDYSEIGARSFGWDAPAPAQGALNGGGPVLNLNTSGVIYIRKSRE